MKSDLSEMLLWTVPVAAVKVLWLGLQIDI